MADKQAKEMSPEEIAKRGVYDEAMSYIKWNIYMREKKEICSFALRFEVTAEKFELQTHADLEQVLSKYLLLLKVFTQHENRNMMTPEVSGDFTYNFDCVGEMVESMHFSNDSLSSTGSSDTMGVPNTCGFKYLATPGYFKDGHGQHALRSLPKQALRILHNYAL